MVEKSNRKDTRRRTYSYGFIIVLKVHLRTAFRWNSWVRHCATNRNVVGSTPDGVMGIFYGHDPSGYTMILGINSASNRNEYQGCPLG